MDNITIVQGITLSIAVLGAVLGIINTWHALNRSRVKLKVRPAHAIPVENKENKEKQRDTSHIISNDYRNCKICKGNILIR